MARVSFFKLGSSLDSLWSTLWKLHVDHLHCFVSAEGGGAAVLRGGEEVLVRSGEGDLELLPFD